jgi:hypothetical protein
LKICYPLGQNFQNDLYEAGILDQRQMGSFSTVSAHTGHWPTHEALRCSFRIAAIHAPRSIFSAESPVGGPLRV